MPMDSGGGSEPIDAPRISAAAAAAAAPPKHERKVSYWTEGVPSVKKTDFARAAASAKAQRRHSLLLLLLLHRSPPHSRQSFSVAAAVPASCWSQRQKPLELHRKKVLVRRNALGGAGVGGGGALGLGRIAEKGEDPGFGCWFWREGQVGSSGNGWKLMQKHQQKKQQPWGRRT